MKKIICLILLFALALPLLGCTEEKAIREPVNFYYRRANIAYNSADGVIASEIREADGHAQNYEYLISQYVKGPKGEDMNRTFPRNTTLVSLQIEDARAYIVLSDSFSFLSGMDLTLACACLTLTVCQLTGVQEVTVRTPATELDGSGFITMTQEDVLLLDSSVSPQ